MQLDELTYIIKAAGGGENALAYTESLLEKINRLESTGRCDALLGQLRAAREPGNFRGHVLEVNFADMFIQKGVPLEYGAKQGMTGDIDFCWDFAPHRVFLETKLLGLDQATKANINAQLKQTGASATVVTDDTRDVARLQKDMIQKASTRKFRPHADPHWVNLVGIDVSELLLGTIDICDCLLAAGGNACAAQHCDASMLRDNVVGVFEARDGSDLSDAQTQWVAGVHDLAAGVPHPRAYIHGVMFLFREPKERAALSYDLSAAIVWNTALISSDVTQKVGAALHGLIPAAKR